MNKSTVSYLVEFFTTSNKFIKSEYFTNDVTIDKRNNVNVTNLTVVNVYENIKKGIPDLHNDQCEIKFGVTLMGGTACFGIPTTVKVNLNNFQMRKIKLAFIEDLINE